jgi:hypothetical protein
VHWNKVVIHLAFAAVIFAGLATPGAEELVSIRLNGRYYSEPATLHMTIAVEPSPDNRVLRVEADGDAFYRSADVSLEGSEAPKHHVLSFKNVPAGNYMLRAYVLAGGQAVAVAETPLIVLP